MSSSHGGTAEFEGLGLGEKRPKDIALTLSQLKRRKGEAIEYKLNGLTARGHNA